MSDFDKIRREVINPKNKKTVRRTFGQGKTLSQFVNPTFQTGAEGEDVYSPEPLEYKRQSQRSQEVEKLKTDYKLPSGLRDTLITPENLKTPEQRLAVIKDSYVVTKDNVMIPKSHINQIREKFQLNLNDNDFANMSASQYQDFIKGINKNIERENKGIEASNIARKDEAIEEISNKAKRLVDFVKTQTQNRLPDDVIKQRLITGAKELKSILPDDKQEQTGMFDLADKLSNQDIVSQTILRLVGAKNKTDLERTKENEGKSDPTFLTYPKDFVMGIAKGYTSALKSLSGFSSGIEKISGVKDNEIMTKMLMDTAKDIDKKLETHLSSPNAKQNFGRDVAQGYGSMVSFLVPSIIAQPLGISATATSMILGALMNSGDEYQRILEHENGNQDKALIGLLVNAGLGLTEALPIANLFKGIGAVTGKNLFRQIGKRTFSGIFVEGSQEFGQTLGQGITAKLTGTSDQSGYELMNDAIYSGAIGGIIGGNMNLVGISGKYGLSKLKTKAIDKKLSDSESKGVNELTEIYSRIEQQFPKLIEKDQEKIKSVLKSKNVDYEVKETTDDEGDPLNFIQINDNKILQQIANTITESETDESKSDIEESGETKELIEKSKNYITNKPPDEPPPPGTSGMVIPETNKILKGTVSEFNDLYLVGEQNIRELENKIQPEISKLKEGLKDTSGSKKEQNNRKNNITKKIKELQMPIEEAREKLNDDFLGLSNPLNHEIVKIAKSEGVDLGDYGNEYTDDWDSLFADVYEQLTERPGIENNWDRPVQDVIRDVVNDYKEYLEGKKDSDKVDVKKSSTQVNIPKDDAKPFIDFANSIPEQDIYDEEEHTGRETEPHITALYGLRDYNPEDIKKLIENTGDVEVTLGETSLFENDNYDVLKVDVESSQLREINKKLSDNLIYDNDYKGEYIPHLTIAYLKKGEGKKYAGDKRFVGKKIKISELLFSDPDRNKTPINLSVSKASKKTSKKELKGTKQDITPVKEQVKKPEEIEHPPGYDTKYEVIIFNKKTKKFDPFEVYGKPIKIFGWENLETQIHKLENNTYTVSEIRTGVAISHNETDEGRAITKAQDILNRNWNHVYEEINSLIDKGYSLPGAIKYNIDKNEKPIKAKSSKTSKKATSRGVKAIEDEIKTIEHEVSTAKSNQQKGKIVEKIDNVITDINEELTIVGFYDSTGDTAKDIRENGSKTPEKKFKKDLVKYSKELAKALGYEHDTDKKGKPVYADTYRDEGSIILWKPNSDYGVHIHYSGDLDLGNDEIGDFGHDTLRIRDDIMWRATSKKHKYTGFRNKYISKKVSIGEFAKKIRKEVAFNEGFPESKKTEGEDVILTDKKGTKLVTVEKLDFSKEIKEKKEKKLTDYVKENVDPADDKLAEAYRKQERDNEYRKRGETILKDKNLTEGDTITLTDYSENITGKIKISKTGKILINGSDFTEDIRKGDFTVNKETQKSEAIKKKIEKVDDDLQNAWNDLIKTSAGKIHTGVDPEILAKGTKVIELYIKKGIYSFELILDEANKVLKEKFNLYFSALKQSYLAYYGTAESEEADKMTDPRTVRSMTPDNYQSPTDKITELTQNAEKFYDENIEEFELAKGEIDYVVHNIVGNKGAILKAGLKTKDRSIRKIVYEYNGDTTQIKDIARNTIAVYNEKDIDSIIADVLSRYENKIIKNVNFIHKPDDFGYSHAIIVVETSNGKPAEIQINMPGTLVGKSKKILPLLSKKMQDMFRDNIRTITKSDNFPVGLGHWFYETYQLIRDNGHNIWNSEELSKIEDNLKKASVIYYDLFRMAFNSELYSSSDISYEGSVKAFNLHFGSVTKSLVNGLKAESSDGLALSLLSKYPTSDVFQYLTDLFINDDLFLKQYNELFLSGKRINKSLQKKWTEDSEDIIEQFIKENGLDIPEPSEYFSSLEKKGFDYARKNTAKLIMKYINVMTKKNDKRTINSDNVRELFFDVGYNFYNANDFHEPASAITKIIYEYYLWKFKSNDEFTPMLFMIGSPGAGKTSTAKQVLGKDYNKYAIIFDGVLADFKSLDKKLKQAVNKDFIPTITYVYSPPIKAFANVIKRLSHEPRPVPLNMFIDTYKKFPHTLKSIHEFYNGIYGYSIIDNSYEQGNWKIIGIEKIDNLNYNPNRKELLDLIKQSYENGKINDEQLEGILPEGTEGKAEDISYIKGTKSLKSDSSNRSGKHEEGTGKTGQTRPGIDENDKSGKIGGDKTKSPQRNGKNEEGKQLDEQTTLHTDELLDKKRSESDNKRSLSEFPEEETQRAGTGGTDRDIVQPVSGYEKLDKGSRSKTAGTSGTNASLGTYKGIGSDTTGYRDGIKNYRITEDSIVTQDTFKPKEKAENNISAIELLLKLKNENRLATPDEQDILVKYVGWGGISQIFDENKPDWKDLRDKLKSLLSESEYNYAKSSSLDAFYTHPAVIRAMYNILQHLGFKGGRINDPSMGTGHFFGVLPKNIADKSILYGVELDKITGEIAKHLYPQAKIKVSGYEKVTYPQNYFDVSISNVPFGEFGIYDPTMPDITTRAIHNYFFAKALEETRPGGIVAFITSKFTLDATKKEFREYINDKAVFLGAVRLPNTAFKSNANTEVVSDIIFLKKRSPRDKTKSAKFQKTVKHKINGKELPLNEYYSFHPEMIIGNLELKSGQFGDQLTVSYKGDDIETDITEKAKEIIESGAYKHVSDSEKVPIIRDYLETENNYESELDGAFIVEGNKILRKEYGGIIEIDLPDTPAGKIRGDKIRRQIEISKIGKKIIEKQISSSDDSFYKEEQQKLNEIYDEYFEKYGYLNAKSNSDILSTKDYGDDPNRAYLLSLENWDDEKLTGEKADIFNSRVAYPEKTEFKIESLDDAIAVSYNMKGYFDIEHISELYEKTKDQVIDELKQFRQALYDGNNWIPREEYLSGNTKEKLKAVQELYDKTKDDIYLANIEELKKVVPENIPIQSINISMGTNLIAVEVYNRFLKDIFNISDEDIKNINLTYVPVSSSWSIDNHLDNHSNTKLDVEYGMPEANAIELFRNVLNFKRTVIKYRDIDGVLRKDVEKSELAKQKEKLINNAFLNYILTNRDVSKIIEDEYNDTLNIYTIGEYNGQHLTLPNINVNILFRLFPHVKDAVYRILKQRDVLLGHTVGAGKTWTMSIASMEMRRLGLAKKPIHVVKNSMLGQYAREFLLLYPNAKVLILHPENIKPRTRSLFLNRIKNGNWDAIITPYRVFESLSVDPKIEEEYINEQLSLLYDALSEAEAEQSGNGIRRKSRSVKEIEKQIRNLTVRLNKILGGKSAKEVGITFEELGIDQLFVDEAHNFKNLYFPTKLQIKGLAKSHSNRATDLYLKTISIRKRFGKGIVFATGTPISNTMAEMYTMQRYLQPDVLKRVGLERFDDWIKAFGNIDSEYELNIVGQLVEKQKLKKFQNLPEIMRMYRQFADIKTKADLNLKVPELYGGENIKMLSEKNEHIANYLLNLARRYENVLKPDNDPRVDNPLKICNDGKKASVDLRLVGINEDLPDSKVNRMVREIYENYKESQAVLGTQLVFCDFGIPQAKINNSKEINAVQKMIAFRNSLKELSKNQLIVEKQKYQKILSKLKPPKKDIKTLNNKYNYTKIAYTFLDDLLNDYKENEKTEYIDESITHLNSRISLLKSEEKEANSQFNLYEDIKKKLVRLGIPANEIAFSSDPKTDIQKTKQYDDTNKGKIRVLIGTTGKLGEGVNIQKRLYAEYHLNPPWKPSEMEQREGRILRSGNINPTVKIYNMIQERSFDIYNYKLLAGKQTFISQLYQKDVSIREMEDIDDRLYTFNEISAMATGDESILNRARLEQEVNELSNYRIAYYSSQNRIKDEIERLPSSIKYYENKIKELRPYEIDIPKEYSIKIGDEVFEDKPIPEEAKERAKQNRAYIREINKKIDDEIKITQEEYDKSALAQKELEEYENLQNRSSAKVRASDKLKTVIETNIGKLEFEKADLKKEQRFKVGEELGFDLIFVLKKYGSLKNYEGNLYLVSKNENAISLSTSEIFKSIYYTKDTNTFESSSSKAHIFVALTNQLEGIPDRIKWNQSELDTAKQRLDSYKNVEMKEFHDEELLQKRKTELNILTQELLTREREIVSGQEQENDALESLEEEDEENDEPPVIQAQYEDNEIRGEYWIDNTGQELYADGDIGDYNHESHIIEMLRQEAGELLKDDRFEGRQDYPTEKENKILLEEGMSQEAIDIINGKGDARDYAMKHWGYIRVTGNNIQAENYDEETFRNIQEGIMNILDSEGAFEREDDLTGQEYYIEFNNPRLTFSSVPFEVLDTGTFSDLATHRDRFAQFQYDEEVNNKNIYKQNSDVIYSKNFKDWFGDWENDPENASKVVTNTGEPLIVYHGTEVIKDFHEFRNPKDDIGSHFGTSSIANFRIEQTTKFRKYFVKNAEFRERVYPVYLNIRNPLVLKSYQVPIGERYNDIYDLVEFILADTIDAKGRKQIQRLADKYMEEGLLSNIEDRKDRRHLVYIEALKKHLGKLGYDGFVYSYQHANGIEGNKSFVAFYPNQIKSAIGNKGTFDKNDNRIEYQRAEKKTKGDNAKKEYIKALTEKINKVFPNIKVNIVNNKETADILRKIDFNQQQVSAYHGTSYLFDKFSNEHIGSGEGNQAFGYGLYFTSEPDIAKYYANMMSEKYIRMNLLNYETYDSKTEGMSHNERMYLNKLIFDVIPKTKSKTEAIQILRKMDNQPNEKKLQNLNTIAQKIIENFDEDTWDIKRAVYKVDIHKGKKAKDYDYIRWDKPVTKQQLDKVISALEKGKISWDNESIFIKNIQEIIEDIQDLRDFNITGEQLYYLLQDAIGDPYYDEELYNQKINVPKLTSEFLKSAGIDGFKYPTNYMTGMPGKGYNYVVFEDADIDIKDTIAFQKGDETPLGFVFNGEVYINIDKARIDTPIHEFGHIWEAWAEQYNKPLHKQGMLLVAKDNELIEAVKKSYPKLKGRWILKEALARVIGEQGANIIAESKAGNKTLKERVLMWLKKLWDSIKNAINTKLNIDLLNPENMSLKDFVEAVAKDLLGDNIITYKTSEDLSLQYQKNNQNDRKSKQDQLKSELRKPDDKASETIKKIYGAFINPEVRNTVIRDFTDSNGDKFNLVIPFGNDDYGVAHIIRDHFGEDTTGTFFADELYLIPDIIKNGKSTDQGNKIRYDLIIKGLRFSVVVMPIGTINRSITTFFTSRKPSNKIRFQKDLSDKNRRSRRPGMIPHASDFKSAFADSNNIENIQDKINPIVQYQKDNRTVIRNRLKNVRDIDDIIQLFKSVYGNKLPIYHATTPENAVDIEKNGLKPVEVNNRKSFSSRKGYYVQVGRSDYGKPLSERNNVFMAEVNTEDFISIADADTDSIDTFDNQEYEELNTDTEDYINAIKSNNYSLEGIELFVSEELLEDKPQFNGLMMKNVSNDKIIQFQLDEENNNQKKTDKKTGKNKPTEPRTGKKSVKKSAKTSATEPESFENPDADTPESEAKKFADTNKQSGDPQKSGFNADKPNNLVKVIQSGDPQFDSQFKPRDNSLWGQRDKLKHLAETLKNKFIYLNKIKSDPEIDNTAQKEIMLGIDQLREEITNLLKTKINNIIFNIFGHFKENVYEKIMNVGKYANAKRLEAIYNNPEFAEQQENLGYSLPRVKKIAESLELKLKPEERQAYNKLRKILDDYGQMLVDAGLIEESHDQYFPFRVLEYINEYGILGTGAKRVQKIIPGSSKKMRGTGEHYDIDAVSVIMEHLTQNERAIAFNRFEQNILKKFDRQNKFDKVTKKPHPGYVEYYFDPRRNFFKVKGLSDKALSEIIMKGSVTDQELMDSLRDYMSMGRKKGHRYIIPEGLADTISDLHESVIAKNIPFVANVTRWWKKQMVSRLGLFTVFFHSRNMRTDNLKTFVNYPETYVYLPQVDKYVSKKMNLAQKGFINLVDITGTTKVVKTGARAFPVKHNFTESEFNQYWDEGIKAGTFSGQMTAEALSVSERELKTLFLQPGLRKSFRDLKDKLYITKLLDNFDDVSRMRETKLRFALYSYLRGVKGLSQAEAHYETGKTMINYNHFTPTEKRWFINFLYPFWSWRKGNIETTIQQLKTGNSKQRARIVSAMILSGLVPAIYNYLWYPDDEEKLQNDPTKRYISESFHIATPYRDSNGNRIYIYDNTFMDDITSMFGVAGNVNELRKLTSGQQNIIDGFGSMAWNTTKGTYDKLIDESNPYAKLVFELRGNRNLYYGFPIYKENDPEFNKLAKSILYGSGVMSRNLSTLRNLIVGPADMTMKGLRLSGVPITGVDLTRGRTNFDEFNKAILKERLKEISDLEKDRDKAKETALKTKKPEDIKIYQELEKQVVIMRNTSPEYKEKLKQEHLKDIESKKLLQNE